MHRLYILITIFAISFSSCSDDEQSTSEKQNPVETGLSTQTINRDNKIRQYVQYIPDSYDGSTAVPLMLNFHGFGGKASGHMQICEHLQNQKLSYWSTRKELI